MFTTFFNDNHLSFINEPKVIITKDNIGVFSNHAYILLEHIFYGYLEWDLLFKLKNMHSMYLNRLSRPDIFVTRSIPYKSVIFAGNVMGINNLIDMTFLAELYNDGKINHSALRLFLKTRMKYSGFIND